MSAFNYYYGRGNRVEETVRGFGYHNQDLSFIKNTKLPGNTNFQFRLEAFNVWNWHMFSNPGAVGRPRLHQRPRQSGLRQMERHR